jgi:hypothetical protein
MARDYKVRPTVNGVQLTLVSDLAPVFPAWKGVIHAAYGNGDPEPVLTTMQSGLCVSPTSGNVTVSLARCSYLRADTTIIVNKIRFVGAATLPSCFRCAIYRDSDSARMTADLAVDTVVGAWGSAGSALNVTLIGNLTYFIAVSVTSPAAGVGPMAFSSSVVAAAGMLPLPTAWPGSLDVDVATARVPACGFSQFVVAAGVLPATAPARAARAAWVGGMPAFFLDSSNA